MSDIYRVAIFAKCTGYTNFCCSNNYIKWQPAFYCVIARSRDPAITNSRDQLLLSAHESTDEVIIYVVVEETMSLEVTISKGLCQNNRDFWVCV